MILRFTPEADAELTEARQWYSHHRKDLDLEFMQCIEEVLSRIQSNPRLFPVVYGGLRRAIVRRFHLHFSYSQGRGDSAHCCLSFATQSGYMEVAYMS